MTAEQKGSDFLRPLLQPSRPHNQTGGPATVLALDKPQARLVAGGYEMAISTIVKSQTTAARIPGLTFPFSFAIVVAVNFAIFARLIVSGNPADTLRNILAHETLFRVGIAGDMVYCVGVVVLLTALYVILKPVSRSLAWLGACGRLIPALTCARG